MRKRSRVPSRKGKRRFTKTALRTNKKNSRRKPMRGGGRF